MQKLAVLLVMLVLVSLMVIFTREKQAPTDKKSVFVLVGGGKTPPEAYAQFRSLAGGEDAKIVVIPSASDNPAGVIRRWAGEGVGILHAASRIQALEPDFSDILDDATGVWFSGGCQMRLSILYKDTPVEERIRKLLARGGVVGGTSAGASIVSDVMVYDNQEAYGLALTSLVVDQHFGNRTRLDRLLKILAEHPHLDGIGIDEDTAVIVDGNIVTVIGAGNVVFCQQGKITIHGDGAKFALNRGKR